MKIIYTILLTLIYSTAFCQVNIESIRGNSKSKGLYGEVQTSLELQKGNVNAKSYSINQILHYKNKNHHVLFKSSANKGYQDESLFRNNAFFHIRYTNMFFKHLGYEVFSQTEYDEFKDLKIRQLNGSGLRLEFNTYDNVIKIAIGTGLMLDYEKLTYESTTHARSTSYASITKSFDTEGSNLITAVTYYQPLLFNYKDYRINNEINLRSSMIKSKEYSLNLIVSFNYLYDTVPAIKIQNTDILMKTGLSFSWK